MIETLAVEFEFYATHFLNFGDLVKRDGLYHKTFTDVPFTGKMTGKEQGSFKNGKKDGPWVSYHENGELRNKVNYKNGGYKGGWVNYWPNGYLN